MATEQCHICAWMYFKGGHYAANYQQYSTGTELHKFHAYTIHVGACGPIGTTFGTHMQIHLGTAMGKIKIAPCDLWGHLAGFRGSQIQKSGIPARRLDRSAPNLAHLDADSSGNEHRLKQISPSRPRRGILGA